MPSVACRNSVRVPVMDGRSTERNVSGGCSARYPPGDGTKCDLIETLRHACADARGSQLEYLGGRARRCFCILHDNNDSKGLMGNTWTYHS